MDRHLKFILTSQLFLRQTFLGRTLDQGSYKELQPFFKDFSRTPLDFQGPPTTNTISQIVQKCAFLVYSNKALRLKLFASPTSLQFSVHLIVLN